MKQHNNIEYSKGFTTTSSHSCGFTLIELLVVIAVVGILAAGILVALDIGGIFGKADIAKGKRFAQSLESGLIVDQVGKWSFEDGAGATAFKDSSRFKNDGSCTSCPTVQDEDTCGLGLGGCVSFNGTTNYVDVDDHDSLNFGTGDFTVLAWVKTSSGAKHRVVNKWLQSSTLGWVLDINTEASTTAVAPGTVRFRMKEGSNNFDYDTDDVKVNDDNWHLITITVDRDSSTGFKVYKDGVQVGTSQDPTAVSGSISANTNLGIGVIPSNLDLYYNGFMDEIAIYSESLNAYQIQHLYVSGLLRHQLAKTLTTP